MFMFKCLQVNQSIVFGRICDVPAGLGLQILQQLGGINTVMVGTPHVSWRLQVFHQSHMLLWLAVVYAIPHTSLILDP